jgi:putative aldouronate transport system substrate-binding protein
MWYNTMQLEKLNLEPPKTADEFYNALVKYRQANPGGVPLSGEVGHIIPFLINMYTYYPAGFGNEFGLILSGGKVSTMLNSEGYRSALEYMNKLYREKLLYEGTFTMDTNQLRALINSPGEPVLFMGQMHNVVFVDGNQSPELYAHQRALPPLAGPNGTRYVSFQPTDILPSGAISSSCKNVEKAAAFLDLWYDLESSLTIISGVKGVNWDYADPGAVGIDGMSPATYKRLTEYNLAPQENCWEPVTMVWNPGPSFSILQGDRNPDYTKPTLGAQLRQFETVAKYRPAYQDTYQSLSPAKFTSDENEALSTLRVSLENYIKQMRVAFITGERNLSSDWDTYVQGLESQGMSRLAGYYQAAYDRTK